jgi:signal transduction histidine kinase
VQPAQQPPWQTRLTPWSHVWRYTLALAISAVAWGEFAPRQWHQARALFWIDVVLGVVCFALSTQRRRWPMQVAVVTNVLAAFSGLAAGPATLSAVSLATRRRWPQVAVLALVCLVSAQTYANVQPHAPDSYGVVLSVNAGVTIAMLGWGMYIGSRRELLWSLRDQVARATSEQALRSEQARAGERARIAREMHDVLAHRISQVSMHAGALAFRDDLTVDQMRESAAVIQAQANEALHDLRGVLGVLRDPETGESLDGPQPTYDDVAGLVAAAREHGMKVEFSTALPDGEPVPATAGRTVYRIVQEGLTNAAKHAPGSTVLVQLSGTPDEGIDVLVRNPLGFTRSRTPGAGLGLVGLTERAELRGGRLEHRADGSTFVLHGWIPWAA